MARPPDLCAAILAGGLARRIGGANKAALDDRRPDASSIGSSPCSAMWPPTVFVVGGDPARVARRHRGWCPTRIAGRRRARRHLHRDHRIAVRAHAGRRLRHAVPVAALPADAGGRSGRGRGASRGASAATSRSARSTARHARPRCAARIDRGELQAAVRRRRGARRGDRPRRSSRRSIRTGCCSANVNTPHDYERVVSLIAPRRPTD